MFTIGCDPEIFLLTKTGKPKSVIGLLGADKWHPRKLSEVGHAVLEDNVAVEFNIPPCNTFEQFRDEVKKTMQMVKDILPKNLQWSQESAISFPNSELKTAEAWVFGCEPDYNAWTKEVNPKPHADDENLRSAGGHIHVGSSVAINNPVSVVRAMDKFLGVASVLRDSGTLRRKLYGGAGAFRFKNYGVEYRTLSNFWIFDESNIQWAYEGTQQALNFVTNGGVISDEEGQLIQQCINTSDVELAEYLVKGM